MSAMSAWDVFGDDADESGGGDAVVVGRGALASAHEFFLNSRVAFGRRGASTTRAEATMESIVRDYESRSSRMAAELGERRPHGVKVEAATRAAVEAAVAGDAREAATHAKRALDGCAAQLAIGNWPCMAFLEAHTLALGVVLVCGVTTADDAEAETEAENDPTTSAALRGERWNSSERLGRVALEILNACMLFEGESVPMWCADAVRLAEREISASSASDARSLEHAVIPTSLPERGVPVVAHSRAVLVEQASALAPPRFYTDYVSQQTPVVIENLLGAKGENWGALELFKTLDIFQKYGDTIVPVEYGTAFDSHGTGVTTLAAFTRTFLASSNAAHDGAPASERVAYVSQHPLFHQIPELQDAITVPTYTLGRLKTSTSAVNIWIGTSGTRTAIHRDPYLNLLCQVAGYKYVRVYDDAQTPYMHAMDTDTLRAGNANTFTRCPADPESEESLREYPLLRRAAFVERVLGPGDVLFIPEGHWHYVRSLTTSVSINFWFK
jgi:lysine-specific demethylase 8